MKRLEW